MAASDRDGVVDDEQVLIVAPTRRDGAITLELLAQASVRGVVCAGALELARHLDHGTGAALLTEHALIDPGIGAFLAALGQQPEWSDVPVLVLSADRDPSSPVARVL